MAGNRRGSGFPVARSIGASRYHRGQESRGGQPGRGDARAAPALAGDEAARAKELVGGGDGGRD